MGTRRTKGNRVESVSLSVQILTILYPPVMTSIVETCPEDMICEGFEIEAKNCMIAMATIIARLGTRLG